MQQQAKQQGFPLWHFKMWWVKFVTPKQVSIIKIKYHYLYGWYMLKIVHSPQLHQIKTSCFLSYEIIELY